MSDLKVMLQEGGRYVDLSPYITAVRLTGSDFNKPWAEIGGSD